jgi:hypothetical protein
MPTVGCGNLSGAASFIGISSLVFDSGNDAQCSPKTSRADEWQCQKHRRAKEDAIEVDLRLGNRRPFVQEIKPQTTAQKKKTHQSKAGSLCASVPFRTIGLVRPSHGSFFEPLLPLDCVPHRCSVQGVTTRDKKTTLGTLNFSH